MSGFACHTSSTLATEKLGEALAALLPDGALVALRGHLGTGKTCLVRGMARAISGVPLVHSPTFTLINEYRGARTLYHLDLYRLQGAYELLNIGFEELVGGAAVTVIEWAEHAEGLLPLQRVDVDLEHAGGDKRAIHITHRDVLPEHWQEHLTRAL